jgi:hypothetical protein
LKDFRIGGRDLSEFEFELSRIKTKPVKFLRPKSEPIFCLRFFRAASFNSCAASRLLLESLTGVDVGGAG